MSLLTPVERRLAADIDPAPVLSTTLSWAAINSGTGNLAGLETMARMLADAFAVLPGAVSLEDAAPVETVRSDGRLEAITHGRHVVVQVRPEADRRLLLTGHMDTVYPADHMFQHCRIIDTDTVNGPGTADMKGGLALMLAALIRFEETGGAGGRTLGYDVLINSDEETGSKSSAALIAAFARHKHAALTYEPALADGAMARARPGSGNFSVVVRGRSAHAGRNPEDGRNAIVAAADLAQRLYTLRRPDLSVNPARIDGGSANNVVPDLAILRINLRPASDVDLAEAKAALARESDAIALAHDVTTTIHGGFDRPPKKVDAGTEALFDLVRGAAADLDQPLRWVDTGGVCDGNLITAAGVPVLDTMGARGGAIHSAEEFLIVSSLAERARLTALVLHRLEGGVLS